jgi:hypothetical protein
LHTVRKIVVKLLEGVVVKTRKLLNIVLALCVVVGLAASATFASAEEKGPETVSLKASMGNVNFPHAAHSKMAGVKCTDCHHASKPDMPKKTDFQACRDCHTKPATAPVKAALPQPFHNPAAQAGLCIDCHKKAANEKAPTKCAGCHKKA